MENVEVMKDENQAEAPAKKVAKVKKDPKKVAFMEARNEARKKAGHKPAYSEEQIKAYK